MADQVEHLAAEEPMAGKGLKSGALGLWGNVTIGLASTAPAYSLAATLGYVVLAVAIRRLPCSLWRSFRCCWSRLHTAI
jgi:hypothetical protein